MRERSRTFRRQLGRMAAICMASVAVIFLLCAIALTPVRQRPAYAVHNDWYTVCPSPIVEGETGKMRIRLEGYGGLSVTISTYYDGYTADPSDFVVYDGVLMTGAANSQSVWVPVITKEDSHPERNEIFTIGYWDDRIWHGCVIMIMDDDYPEITDVEIGSRPVNGTTYRAGESIGRHGDAGPGGRCRGDTRHGPLCRGRGRHGLARPRGTTPVPARGS